MQFLVLFAVVVAVVTVGMYLAGNWAERLFSRGLVANLKAGETIVEENRLPDAWIRPYRKKIDGMRRAGKKQQDIDKVGRQAQKDWFKKMDDLIVFFQKTNLTDSPDTKEQLLSTLSERRQQWAGMGWEVLLENRASVESPDAVSLAGREGGLQ